MKNMVKDTLIHFEIMLKHSMREYEPSPAHIMKRLVAPLCQDFTRLAEKGTRGDAWEVITGISQTCRKLIK
ncbi:MAG: hypothetical protein JSU92_00585 [Deltaproteobacteria bacterium]|nr:MAG: hypothetical protein JSU92_00585 [Deltaproteobacteria bacterium]